MPTLETHAKATTWPPLPYEEWKDTLATLHLWTQVVGKIRLAQTPWTNHSWHVTLYVTSRGLTTSPIPYGTRTFEMVFDFLDHELRILTGEGAVESVRLARAAGRRLLSGRVGATRDSRTGHRDPHHALRDPGRDPVRPGSRYMRPTSRSRPRGSGGRSCRPTGCSRRFAARFLGKSSPVHFFWGGFDLAVTRFSGRRAPPHPGGVPNMPDWVARDAYSHEVSSCGFWPGGDGPASGRCSTPTPIPSPKASRRHRCYPRPPATTPGLSEFVLAYDDVRTASAPDAALLEFLQSTYEAAADRGWDRAALEGPS